MPLEYRVSWTAVPNDVPRPDGLRLREDSGFHLVERLLACWDLFRVQLASFEVGEEELSCRGSILQCEDE